MAGPPRLPSTAGLLDSTTLGRAPRDGDFARLLEAASTPAAHRLDADPDGGEARAARFGGAPPRAPDAATAVPGDAPAEPIEDTTRFGARPPAPHGPPGMAAGRTLPAAFRTPATATAPNAADPPPAGPPDLADLAGRAGRAWARRPLKDRLVIALLAMGAGWMLLTIVAAALADPEGNVGTLLALAMIAFFVFGGWRRRRRPDSAKG